MKPVDALNPARINLALMLLLATAQGRADFLALPEEDYALVGVESVAVAGADDTLADIARRYDLGHVEIRLANPDVEFWLPGEGTRVEIPSRYLLPEAERRGFVINIPEMRLYYFPPPRNEDEPGVVITHPISIGRQDWATPLGTTRVTAKVENPSWTPPESIRREHAADGDFLPAVVPPGPDNPLGNHAIRLALPGYLLHGTNRPYGVGMRVTHGCIRLYPEDIEALFDRVAVGTPVQFVKQPIKVGWGEDGLYMEVHPVLEEDERGPAELVAVARALVNKAAGDLAPFVADEELLRLVQSPSGRPVILIRKGVTRTGT